MEIDTLQISEDLKKAGLDSKLAKEFANQFKLIRKDIITKEEISNQLATKSDIENVKLEIENVKLDIEHVKSNIENVKLEIEKLKAETSEKIEKLRAETAKSFQNQTMWLSGIIITGFIAIVSLIISQ